MTHAGLVKRAARWLENSSYGCKLVIAGGFTSVSEMPDAIGFQSAMTTVLVECKATRADFLRDAQKQFRRHPQLGMGRCRYYFAPKGIIGVDELPDGWGLVEVGPKVIERRRTSRDFEPNRHAELRLLFTLAAQQKSALEDLHRAWRRMGR